jgi:WD40 repeat protein
MWQRDSGSFLKKYDLSSFTNENVSTIKLGKSEGMLFLGSKDMNVYLIDVKKGKLCVVYEGHWSRVSSIYTIPGKDILVTLADSNIKVWDLEYDECIKNMNEHESLVVYCAVSNLHPERITTISQSLEYKQWNYITGQVKKAMILQVGHLINKQKPEEDDFF